MAACEPDEGEILPTKDDGPKVARELKARLVLTGGGSASGWNEELISVDEALSSPSRADEAVFEADVRCGGQRIFIFHGERCVFPFTDRSRVRVCFSANGPTPTSAASFFAHPQLRPLFAM